MVPYKRSLHDAVKNIHCVGVMQLSSGAKIISGADFILPYPSLATVKNNPHKTTSALMDFCRF